MISTIFITGASTGIGNLSACALTTSYEVGPFGIETSIIMPGAFTQGTQHFPNASRASDAMTP